MKIRKEYRLFVKNEVLSEGINSLSNLHDILVVMNNTPCYSLDDTIEIEEFIYKSQLAFSYDRSKDDIELSPIYDLIDIKIFFKGTLENALKKIESILLGERGDSM